MPAPEPFCDTVPAPEIALATVKASERLKFKAAPEDTLTAPAPRLPVVPPAPTCKEPAVMVVVPS